MYIRNQRLTMNVSGDLAHVTVQFTVVLVERDLNLDGGFLEVLWLEPASTPGMSFASVPARSELLPTENAISTGPGRTWKELEREHLFMVPRYPQGPFATVPFYARIKIFPQLKMTDEILTNEGVLPALYSVSSILVGVAKRLSDRLGR